MEITNINLIPTYEQYLEEYVIDEQVSNSYQLEIHLFSSKIVWIPL